MHRMKIITKAALIGLILLIAAVTITAGCVETGDETTSTGYEPTAEPTPGDVSETLDKEIPILGDWKYTFTTDSGETTMVYHFDRDHVGTFSTGNSTSGIHWLYNEEDQTYMVNYDKLQQQEDMIIVLHEGKYYLYSLGGGYACERVE
ncbi:MAG TPA: hypothetical protein O0X84_00840 [Methanocorpusculum sp.]|nr:hypothetical protein [Methanocorpusculum sp.]